MMEEIIGVISTQVKEVIYLFKNILLATKIFKYYYKLVNMILIDIICI